jgi:DNA-binding NarL/FixJ family response regulator
MAAIISVFIIEEHAGVRHALAVRLDHDHELEVVGTASSPPNATLLQETKPAVIILGIANQHQHSDHELATIVQRLSQQAQVIVLTPYVDDAERQRLLTAGASQYLLKRIDSATLVSLVKEKAQQPPKTSTSTATFSGGFDPLLMWMLA